MFISASFNSVKKLIQSNVHQSIQGEANIGVSTERNSQQLRRKHYWHIHQLWWISKALCSVEKGRHKGQKLYNFEKSLNYSSRELVRCYLGLEVEEEDLL